MRKLFDNVMKLPDINICQAIYPFVFEFVFRRFLRYKLRMAPIVYRLISATLIGNFFDDPFLF